MRTIIITKSEKLPVKKVLEAANRFIGKTGIVVLTGMEDCILEYPDNYYFKNNIYGQRIERNSIVRQLG